VAFYDGVERRPEDFGPRRKLVVLTLVPARPASASLGPCEILRVAGVDRLLGGPTLVRPEQDRASVPGSSCARDRSDSSSAISLTIVASPAGSGYVDVLRQQAQAGRKMQIEDEPVLGPGAFSGAGGWTVIVVALKGETAMILRVDALGADRAELRRFAQRVLDAL
jgi:hypothetical protein